MTDWASGDVVCRACGVVVEGHVLDEGPEWWGDGCRAGPPDPRGRLGTYLVKAGGAKRFRHGGGEDPSAAALTEGLRVVDQMVLGLRLSTTCGIAGTAKELFSDLHAARAVRGDTRRATAAAAVYLACKLENAGRDLRLVSHALDVDVRALGAAAGDFKDRLDGKPYHARLFEGLRAGRLIDVMLDRLVAAGALAGARRRDVWRAAQHLDEVLSRALDCGRKPRTICSGLLFVAAQHAAVPLDKKAVAAECEVCQQTLDKVVAQIRGCLAAAPAVPSCGVL